MILRAIEALNEENGSNKSSISKYIESTYGGLPHGHRALLNLHLARMRDSGELVFWKNNYTKRDLNAPPRRGRGRPPKSKEPFQSGTIYSPPKPKGRPPNVTSGPMKVKASVGSGRPRGRPRKMSQPTGGFGGALPVATGTGGSGRLRGRPPKTKPPSFSDTVA